MSSERIFSRSGMTSATMLMVNFASGVLAARVLGADGRGLLGIMIFWPQVLGDFLRPPLSDAIVVQSRSGLEEQLIGCVHNALLWALVACILTVPLLYLVVDIAAREKLGVFWIPSLAFGLVYVITTFFSQPFQGFMRSSNQFRILNTARMSVPVLYLASAVILSIGGMGALGFVLAHIVSRLGAFIGQAIYVFRRIATVKAIIVAGFGGTLIRLWGVSIVTIISSNVDRAFVMASSSTTWIGVYLVAMTLSTPLNGIVSTMLQSVGLPQLLRLETKARVPAYEKLLRVTLTTSVFSAAAVVIAVPFAIPFLFGSEFNEAVPLAIGLCVGLILTPVRVALRAILVAERLEKGVIIGELTYSVGFAAIFLVGSNFFGFSALLYALGFANVLTVFTLWSMLKSVRPGVRGSRWVFFAPKGVPELWSIAKSGLGIER